MVHWYEKGRIMKIKRPKINCTSMMDDYRRRGYRMLVEASQEYHGRKNVKKEYALPENRHISSSF